jgi:hypothetical protein
MVVAMVYYWVMTAVLSLEKKLALLPVAGLVLSMVYSMDTALVTQMVDVMVT